MASIILSTAGAALGSTGGPAGKILGSRLGSLAGGFIDDRLFGRGGATLRDREGPRLSDLAVQTSTYGRMIPIVYGTVRIAGNIIWSKRITETVTTTSTTTGGGGGGGGGKGGGGKVTQTSTSYSYSVSLAVAICEGAVDEVLRIWADAKQLDSSQYTLRVYKGTEDQGADTLIQSVEGAGNTPAYRGLAYVVFEEFPLGDFGNRIPNFTFEVKKKAQYADYNGEILENMIKGVMLIPGAGEFVYDTQVEYKVPGVQVGDAWVQQGNQIPLNMHNASGQANVLLALDQLKESCPNVEWIGLVVAWFGDSLNAADCTVLPGVEYQVGGITQPDTWGSGGYNRGSARLITQEGGGPRYGGTPDDESLIRLCDNIRGRGYKVMMYPIIFMDIAGKPWRGELTGSAAAVADFFTKTHGYNAFITHYANLTAGHVDAFVIGSELKGLTKVTNTPGGYPAVTALVSLAATVKGIVGGGVTVTYAADWSEYHHTDGGYYNLDPLWASANIDVIGIDAYFPLTDEPQNGYDVQKVIDGWTSGEGYDFYYSDGERTVQANLDPPYAWKNIEWFWENGHTNPGGAATGWVPESKPIWFTEYGFPSVDGATNQPNVFYDEATSASAFPYFSKGRVDFRAQRAGLAGTQAKWGASSMVQEMFVWTWDARPYPYWPDLTNVWSDGPNWKTGHWVQGKLGISNLAAIVADLCGRAGLEDVDFNVNGISDPVEGFVITSQQSIRASIEQLQQGYFFDAVESDHVLKFIPRGGISAVSITETDIVPSSRGNAPDLLRATRQQELELPRRMNVVYLNRLANYQPATQYAQREVTSSKQQSTLDLPIVFSDQAAKIVADKALYSGWVGRTTYKFSLPIKYARLEPADIIEVSEDGIEHSMRITSVTLGAPGLLNVEAVAEDVSAYDFYTPPGYVPTGTAEGEPIASTRLEFLDLPAFPGDAADTGTLRFAAVGEASNWSGAVVYRSDDGGSVYARQIDLLTPAVMGNATTVLASGPVCVFDDANTVTVAVLSDSELSSASEQAVLNGSNVAVIGNEVFQFRTATLMEPGLYELSGLLRGRLGTEWAVGTHVAGERFVLLNGLVGAQRMANNLLNLSRKYKPVSIGSTLGTAAAVDYAYGGVALKPYSPVHIAAVRDGSGNITLSWARRTRHGGEWLDYADTTLGETSEAYEVEVMDGGDVIRTVTGLSSPTASYSAADQTADFGGNQSEVTVRVYQLSAVVGRGYAGEAVV